MIQRLRLAARGRWFCSLRNCLLRLFLFKQLQPKIINLSTEIKPFKYKAHFDCIVQFCQKIIHAHTTSDYFDWNTIFSNEVCCRIAQDFVWKININITFVKPEVNRFRFNPSTYIFRQTACKTHWMLRVSSTRTSPCTVALLFHCPTALSFHSEYFHLFQSENN